MSYNKKQTLTVKISDREVSFDFAYFEGPINDVIEYLSKAKSKAMSLGYTDLLISIDESYDGTSAYLYGTREETDEEYKTRINKDRKIREAKKAATKLKKDAEYETYLKLREKFGDIK